MFNWFRNRLAARRRNVFEFWDGSRKRRIDPMVAIRRIKEHPEFDWATTPKLIDSTVDAYAMEAYALTADAVCKAFGVKLFDGETGLTEAECVALLTQFVSWLTVTKKKVSSSPISSPPTESDTPSGKSPTPNRSGSGSTSTAQKPAEDLERSLQSAVL